MIKWNNITQIFAAFIFFSRLYFFRWTQINENVCPGNLLIYKTKKGATILCLLILEIVNFIIPFLR